MPLINFRIELKACFCRIQWLTSNTRHNRNIFHLTWESIFAWALMAWAVFPRLVGVTIWRNLIGLPLLRVVNNSDRWMRKKHGNGAKQVLALDCHLSGQHNNFASYAVDRAESKTLITSLPIYARGECVENCDVLEEKVIFCQFNTGHQKLLKTALSSSVYGSHITVLCHAQYSHARLICQASQTGGQTESCVNLSTRPQQCCGAG